MIMKTESLPIKVMLVEDQQLVREGLKGLLALHSELSLVGEAADGAEAVALLAEMAPEDLPDVVLSDMRMPRLDGLGLIRALAARGWPILLTAGSCGKVAYLPFRRRPIR